MSVIDFNAARAARETPWERRRRLMNPPNTVPDTGITMRNGWPVRQKAGEPFKHLPRRVFDYTDAIRIPNIIRLVAAAYNVRPDRILEDDRMAQFVRPRHVAMWLAKTLTNKGSREIARRFGGRDHTSVLHAISKIDSLRASDADLAAQLKQLISILDPMRAA